jgi:hypothetical protein
MRRRPSLSLERRMSCHADKSAVSRDTYAVTAPAPGPGRAIPVSPTGQLDRADRGHRSAVRRSGRALVPTAVPIGAHDRGLTARFRTLGPNKPNASAPQRTP